MSACSAFFAAPLLCWQKFIQYIYIYIYMIEIIVPLETLKYLIFFSGGGGGGVLPQDLFGFCIFGESAQ